MTNKDADFDTWFDSLKMILQEADIAFSDADSVEIDYHGSRSIFDVADEIIQEYQQ